MHTHTRMTFQRQLSPFGLLHPPQAQLSHGPHAKPGSRPRVAVLHWGHINNHSALRSELQDRGYPFNTTHHGELVAHLVDAIYQGDALQAVRRAAALLQGPGAFAVELHAQAHRLLATRTGPPAALRWHPQRVELIVPLPSALAPVSQGDAVGLYLLPEGDILDIDTRTHGDNF